MDPGTEGPRMTERGRRQSLHPDGAAEGWQHEILAFAHAVEGQQGLVVGGDSFQAAQLQLLVDAAAEHGESGIVPGREIVHSIHILPLFLGDAQTNKRPLCRKI